MVELQNFLNAPRSNANRCHDTLQFVALIKYMYLTTWGQ